MENLTTKARSEILERLGLKTHLTVRIQEKSQSGDPVHDHIGIAYVAGVKIHVINAADYIGEEHDIALSASDFPDGSFHLSGRILAHTKYDYRSLIEAIIEGRRHHVHGDFTRFYEDLRDTLSRLLEVDYDERDSRSDFRILFDTTIGSYLAIKTPWDGYLDATLLHRRIQETGEPGKKIDELSGQIVALNKQKKELHLKMLYVLFEMMHGTATKVITSKDLLRVGFDDSSEPQIQDYYDYL